MTTLFLQSQQCLRVPVTPHPWHLLLSFCFADAFSQSVAFHSPHVAFWRRHTLNFDGIKFINLFFHRFCFWRHLKKSLPNPRWKRFSPMFSSGSFIVVDFTCRSVMHTDFIFLYVMINKDPSASFCIWISRSFSTILLIMLLRLNACLSHCYVMWMSFLSYETSAKEVKWLAM